LSDGDQSHPGNRIDRDLARRWEFYVSSLLVQRASGHASTRLIDDGQIGANGMVDGNGSGPWARIIYRKDLRDMDEALEAKTIRITGHAADEIEAYFAQPLGGGPFGGVVVIHHGPGYDENTKEITRRFAAHEFLAVCPNLHWRYAPGASPDDAAAACRAQGGVHDEQLVGDVEGAMHFIKSLSASNGKVATIGYCSGGRQSFLAACSLPLDAAIDCYGAFVVGGLPEGMVRNIGPIIDRTNDLRCPLLGLFGAEDQHPTSEENAQLEEELRVHKKIYEFHTYEGAGHAFFASDRPNYRPEAAKAGWQAIWEFLGRYVST
jgi:carboxymethylenebutenolidase